MMKSNNKEICSELNMKEKNIKSKNICLELSRKILLSRYVG